MPHMEYDTGVLLSDADEAEVLGRLFGGEELDEGVVLKKDEGAPGFKEGEES